MRQQEDGNVTSTGRLQAMGGRVQDHFSENKRVLTFAEYLSLVEAQPRCHLRNSAQYLLDMFDFYGSEEIPHPTGPRRRFHLFDAPWQPHPRRLVGQEGVQNAIYRILSNFTRQGTVDRVILLHGPNGSSKSTVTDCIARAMEDYSTGDEGALYSFNWVFPSQSVDRSGIGFSSERRETKADESYAHLDEDVIDARLPSEQRDHPLLLIPKELRQELIADLVKKVDGFTPSRYLLEGNLCHRSKKIYEALLGAYEGDYLRVLRHVQVERFYVSRRYRVAAARVEPQLAVDARMQQVTADRSLSALPTALQNVALYEADGQLVAGNRGLIDFADLFKRPPEAFKYLLTCVEEGRVALDPANLFLDLIFIGSVNETHLNAFMQGPEWMSYKARMELVRVPYLLDYQEEQGIYNQQLGEVEAGKHIAPHAIGVAALWAVLSRMHRPEYERYGEGVVKLVKKLTPVQKAALYAEGKIPEEIKGDDAKTLAAVLPVIWGESDADVIYEGRTGASSREVRTALMNAAQRDTHACLTPEAVLEQISELVKETSVYEFLRQEAKDGFYDHKGFINVARDWYLDLMDAEVRESMGLVEESRYGELFSRYVSHVTHFVRKEKLRNEVTGDLEDADARLMEDVEKRLDISEDAETFRQSIMTKIGAWSIDHPGEMPNYVSIFPQHYTKLKTQYFEQQRQRVEHTLQHSLQILADDATGINAEEREQAQQMLGRLRDEHGYCDGCAREAIMMLVRRRYTD
ncbi:MAG: serine protein kinase PrkA [Deltaproteobacteria bacterium]|nr:serine protein kinase PrkA [Deltaproteobacteria bacterium]